jgi:hypothetical protein
MLRMSIMGIIVFRSFLLVGYKINNNSRDIYRKTVYGYTHKRFFILLAPNSFNHTKCFSKAWMNLNFFENRSM